MDIESAKAHRDAMRVHQAAKGLLAAVGTLAAAAGPMTTPTAGAAAACSPPTSQATVEDGFPSRLSSLYGTDIRTGRHECFERVVIELGGTGELPGYRVGYEPDPILNSPAGEPVEVAGDATLVISMGAWMPTMEGDGYGGPRELVPDNVSAIVELEQLENFEGMTAWAVGLDRARPFTVFTLDGPPRIVVDIAVDPAGDGGGPAPGPSLPPTR